jgi:hypothetical protein
MDRIKRAEIRCFNISVLIVVSVAAVMGQSANMTEADTTFVQAVAKADKSALEKSLDADFTWTDARGNVQTRAQVLHELPKPAITRAENAESKTYTYGGLGNVQVNSGRAHVLRVWVKRPAGWKVIVYQE